MPSVKTHPNCTGCRTLLEPDWRVCPYCGAPCPRPITPASPATSWQAWRRYKYQVREGLLPFLRALAAASSESLEVEVEVWRPTRYVQALKFAMRRLGEREHDTRLPPEYAVR